MKRFIFNSKNICRSVQKASYSISQQHFKLIESATTGDVTMLEEISKLPEVDINYGDYDRRTALHLAASEGELAVCEFLVSNGAEVNAVDRGGYTPLESALKGQHDDVLKYLSKNGGVINPDRRDTLVALMLDAASCGSVEEMTRLGIVGANVNKCDYDQRSPLHLAASEGNVQAVEYLLKQGANPSAVDRFGNTPLIDAHRVHGRAHQAIVKILTEHGASSTSSRIFGGLTLATSIRQSFAPLLEKTSYSYCESWSSSGGEFVLQDSLSSSVAEDTSLRELINCPSGRVLSHGGKSPFATCWRERRHGIASKITEETLPGRHVIAQRVGVTSFIVIPILYDDEIHGMLAFYNVEGKTDPPATDSDLLSLTEFVSRILAAGVFGNTKKAVFSEHPGVPVNQQAEVYDILLKQEIFNANLLYAEIDWFYSMGFPKYYYQRFPTKILANHIHSFIAGRKFAATTTMLEDIWVHIENNDSFLGGSGPEQALFMIPAIPEKIFEAESRLQSRMQLVPADKSVSLEYFETTKPFSRGGSKKLGIYVLITSNFAAPNIKDVQSSSSIWDLGSELFLRDKSKMVRYQYEEIINAAKNQVYPVVRVHEPKAGIIPVRIAVQGRTCYLKQVSELLSQNGVWPARKFLETFANGVQVYTIFLKPSVDIPEILRQFTLLFQLPNSTILTPLFLEGKIGADALTYYNAAGRFVYYFLNQNSEEFLALSHTLENDPINLAKLRLLHTSLKREAVSQDRIMELCVSYPSVIQAFTDDFKERTTRNWKKEGPPPENGFLLGLIEKTAENFIEHEIFTALYSFNKAVLKTNVFKKKKAALSFRLDASCLNADWPTDPYGLFFVVGAEFQGFHIRFGDAARGGIRLITSRNAGHYNHNLGTLLSENYGLAFTQNMKNKDIPEFGSKGTVLLRDDPIAQENGFLNFQKYISALLDLLIPHKEVQDNFGQPEVLFLGPDEGTADMMEWAALYGKLRGYAYWRALTTGKPPSLGGVPHDTYGMTTRSVHRCVLGCLRKMGLEESEVTKIQTGGPDGDLGSNEILISKDKTKAIIDGSGVVYDPSGLDREELTRLANDRVMIDHFDESKLSSEGFKVLVSDENITLPNGTIVENGLAFRNNFHLDPLFSADLFVPCGGRPESVNLSNIKDFLNEDGSPRFKIICEGANLFFTNDARAILEDAGVVLYKDASANKGGVTSSSLEVLAALAMDEIDFTEHMCVTNSHEPLLYKSYTQEIQDRIEADADLEFECVWKEHELTGIHRHVLTEQISNKINELNINVSRSDLWDNVNLRSTILQEAIPKTLTDFMPLEKIYENVPEFYLRAIFASYVSSRYVYECGVHASEFSFFDFMQQYSKE